MAFAFSGWDDEMEYSYGGKTQYLQESPHFFFTDLIDKNFVSVKHIPVMEKEIGEGITLLKRELKKFKNIKKIEKEKAVLDKKSEDTQRKIDDLKRKYAEPYFEKGIVKVPYIRPSVAEEYAKTLQVDELDDELRQKLYYILDVKINSQSLEDEEILKLEEQDRKYGNAINKREEKTKRYKLLKRNLKVMESYKRALKLPKTKKFLIKRIQEKMKDVKESRRKGISAKKVEARSRLFAEKIGKGWHLESVRHALASKGIKTGRKRKGKPKVIIR